MPKDLLLISALTAIMYFKNNINLYLVVGKKERRNEKCI